MAKTTVDYREKYKGQTGACASCRHARTLVGQSKGDDKPVYKMYDGGGNWAL